jgi:fructokinase
MASVGERFVADEDGAEPSRRPIATAGECLIDFTPMERDGVTTGFLLHPGGSPLNVAVTIARLAHPAAFVSRVSTDFFGERIIAHLTDNGVRTDLLVRGDEPTTLAFVAYVGRDAVYSFRSEGAADTLLSEADVPVDDLASVAALHFGSIGLLHPVTAATILALGSRLKGRVTLTFDPNVRPSLVADWAAYADVVHECLRMADLVRLSEEDLGAWRDGTGEDLLAVAAAAAPVVLTRAASGSTLHLAGSELHVPGRPVRVVDTVGAGDAYMAGLLVGLAEAGALDTLPGAAPEPVCWRAAMELATATAALTCERPGAHPPTRAEIEGSPRSRVHA